MSSNTYYVTTIYSWLLVASLLTSIRASAENDTSIPLILPVTADSPDVLGISLISGIYGPGTWTAWFLNIFASWRRVGGTDVFDPNTCLFLVGMNWAAVDVVRITKAMNALNKEDEGGYQEKFNKYLGRFGAAFSVLFTGIYHTKYQLLFMMKSSNKRRLYTLAVFS